MEQSKKTIKILCVFICLAVFQSCVPLRERTAIADYIIEPNGKSIQGTENLHAFIFEDKQRLTTFQNYLVAKFKTNDLKEQEFDLVLDGNRYQLLLYDNSELEKYFQVSQFIVTDSRPDSDASMSRPHFMAVSMVNDRNEDCLAENSLLRNIALSYLKKLKDEYLNYYNELSRP